MRISRRVVLAAAGATLGAGAGAFLLSDRFRSEAEIETTLRRILDDIPVPEPEAIGQKYLRYQPREASVETLLQTVFPFLSAETDPVTGNDICRRFGARVETDFENANIFVVDGWVLSATEARFLALLSLV